MNISNLKLSHALTAVTMVSALAQVSDANAEHTDMVTLRVIEKQIHAMETERAEIKMTPGGVTLIDGDALYERNMSSMADMLRFVPGVWAASDSGNDNMFFSSRGSNLDATDFDMNGIKLTRDGLPITMADGNNHNRVIDPLSAAHATVARGANALKYGASTLGGAVNFVTPTAHDTSPVKLFINGGSHGLVQGRATFARVFNNQFDGLVTIEGKQWDGFRDHNEQDRMGVYANAGWTFSETVSTRLYLTYLKNDQELPDSLSREQINQDPDQAGADALGGNFQRDVKTWRVANKTTWIIDDTKSLEIGASFEDQDLFHPIVNQILVDFDGPGPADPVEVFSLLIDTDSTNFGAMLKYKQQIGDHDLLVGVNGGVFTEEGGRHRNLGGSRNGLRTLVDNKASSLEAYVMDRWQIADKWMLIYGTQFVSTDREVKNTTVADGSVRNPKDDYFSINPRAGLIYSLDDKSTLFANVSRLYEPPTTFELEDNAAGGESTLSAMKGTVIELGSRGAREIGGASEINWDVSLYRAWIDDEILSVEDPDAPGESLVTNSDETIHAGIEAAFGARLALDTRNRHSIHPRLSATFNAFSFDDDPNFNNNDLPAAPDYVFKGEILYRNGNGAYIGPTFDLVGDRYADFANTFKIDSYFLLGLRGGWSNERWKFFAEIRNLLDEKHVASHNVRVSASADDEILRPGEPLSAFFGVRFQY